MRNIHEVINTKTAHNFIVWARMNCSLVDFARVLDTVLYRLEHFKRNRDNKLYDLHTGVDLRSIKQLK